MSEQRPLLIEIPFEVRSYDTDFMGIVNNIVYVRWLSDLRHEMLSRSVSLTELVDVGLAPALTRTDVRYKLPIRVLDKPVGRMWISRLRRATWEVQAEFVCGDQIMATAMQEGCFVHLESLRPARVPAAMREAFDEATR